MSRPGGPALSVAVVVALLATGAATVATIDAVAPPPEGRPPVADAPLATATAVCPAGNVPPGSGHSVTTVVPQLTAAPGAGRADLVQLAARRPVSRQAAPGAAARFDRAVRTRTLVARAADSWAPGFSAGQFSRTLRRDDRSLTGGACVVPGAEFWFVGGSTQLGRRGQLWLVNPTDAPAAVDVFLHGPDGPVESAAGRGILVPPRGEETIGLDALAPGLPYAAAHVVVRQGRVSAALLQRELDGLTPRGADWVPAAAAPGRDVIVPGVLADTGSRRLRILVPGEADAVVRLEVVSGSGEAGSPPGGAPAQVVEARAGAVTEVDLTRTVIAHAALRLRADVPVTAGVEVRRGVDLGYAAAAGPQRGPAVVAINHADARVRTLLVLSAVDRPARVRVTPLVPGRPPAAATTLTIAAGGTVVAPARVAGASQFSLLVTPEGGEVVGARYVIEGSGAAQLFTTEPLTPARMTTQVPDVVADLSAAIPTSPRS